MPRSPKAVLSSLILSLGLAAGLLVGGAPRAQAISVSSSYEIAVIKATNAERTKAKRKKLKYSSCLDRYAEARASVMARSRTMKHSNMGTILKGCKLHGVSENIAYGFGSGAAVTRAWMRSPGHRANIMRKSSRLIGTAAVQDASGTWWIAEVMGHK